MNRPKVLRLEPEHEQQLKRLAHSGMTPILVAKRAKILLFKAEGRSDDSIAGELGINRRTVILWVKKYRERTPKDTIDDLLNVSAGRGRKAEITGEVKAWLISVACTKPKDLGYAAETWIAEALARHIRSHAAEAGYDRITTVSTSGVYRILDKSDIKPFRIQYYCERRDPDFEAKMHNVLLVYKQLSFQFDENGRLLPPDGDGEAIHVLSYDEKPGIQAIATVCEDKDPRPGNGTIKRDYEYKRLGTVSLLAGIDLQTGDAIPLVSATHNSDDYIQFLGLLDARYPKGDRIRFILDNLKVRKSAKVQAFLQTIPGRFEFVFTPKHASWLNLIEGFFSKMTKQMLRGIRVRSKQELVDRIYKYFEEINAEPVVYHWTWNLNDVDADEKIQVETFSKCVVD